MTTAQAAIRLTPEGEGEVVQAFKSIERAGVSAEKEIGEAAMRRIAAFREAQSEAVELAQREIDARERVAAASDRTLNRQLQDAARARQAMFQHESNAANDAFFGVGGRSNSAAASAGVFEDYNRQAEAAARLRAAIDPLGAAQARLNTELAEARQLAAGKHITDEELIRTENRLQQEFRETATALELRNQQMQRGGGLTGRQMNGRLNLARQGADVFTTAAMGMNPAMIAVQQGPQILEAMADAGIRLSPIMIGVGGAIAVTAGAVVAMGVAWQQADDKMHAAERVASGMGRTLGLTGEQLQDLAIAAADAGEISTGAAQQMANAYASTGRIGSEQITQLLELHRDYASFVGVDSEEAQRRLAAAMLAPNEAGLEMTRTFGLLSQEQLEQIDNMLDINDLAGAQKILLDELTVAVRGNADEVGEIESAWDNVALAIQHAWDWLGRYLHRTRDERISQLEQTLQLEPGEALRPSSAYGMAGGLRNLQGELGTLRLQRDMDAWNQQGRAADAAANQRAQLDADAEARRNRGRRARGGGDRAGQTAARNAEREAAYQARLDMEEARLENNFDLLRTLENEEQLRRRIAELTDRGMAADVARAQAGQEQARLDDARANALQQWLDQQDRAADIEAARTDGDFARLRQLEDEEAIEARVLELNRRGLLVDEARRRAIAERAAARGNEAFAAQQEREAQQWRDDLDIARSRGDTRAAAIEDRRQRIEARARQIERREGLDFGRGVREATEKIDALIAAEVEGGMRQGVHSLISTLRTSGIDGVLAQLFGKAADRLEERLTDIVMNFLNQMNSNGGGNWLTQGLSWLFGGGNTPTGLGRSASNSISINGGFTGAVPWTPPSLGFGAPDPLAVAGGKPTGPSSSPWAASPAAALGASAIRIDLGPDLVARILSRAANQSIEIAAGASREVLAAVPGLAGPAAIDHFQREGILAP